MLMFGQKNQSKTWKCGTRSRVKTDDATKTKEKKKQKEKLRATEVLRRWAEFLRGTLTFFFAPGLFLYHRHILRLLRGL